MSPGRFGGWELRLLAVVLAGCGADEHDHGVDDPGALFGRSFEEKDDSKADSGCSGVRVPDQAGFDGRVALTFDDGPSPRNTLLVPETLRAHEALFCRGMSRTDFRVRGGEPIALEVNTLPGLTETSLLPQAAAAAGIPFRDLLTRLVDFALEDAPE